MSTLSDITNTSVQDAESSLRCDEANDCRITIDLIRRAIGEERKRPQPRTAMLKVYESAIRRRERLKEKECKSATK